MDLPRRRTRRGWREQPLRRGWQTTGNCGAQSYGAKALGKKNDPLHYVRRAAHGQTAGNGGAQSCGAKAAGECLRAMPAGLQP